MDIRLIRANIALAEDDRLEVQRLLDDYRRDVHHENEDDESLVLWLEAHAQTDHNALVRRLEMLLKRTPPYDPYHQMAHDYLWQEDTYAATIADIQHQSRAIPGVTWRRMVVAMMVLAALVWLAAAAVRRFSRPSEPTAVAVAPADFVVPTLRPTPLPDNTIELNINEHTARYEGGLLLVAGLEDDSHRVVDPLSGELLTPVDGARFYVLEIFFECRQGICNKPPEAYLSLTLDNDLTVAPRDGATVENAPPMQPIALGRRTTGWVVFEVPIISEVVDLVVTPTASRGRNEVVVIPLELPDSR